MNDTKLETATFGAGCFWGVEEAFRVLPGVAETAVGYAGGLKPKDGKTVTYEEVCGGATNHAEVVKIMYDPRQTTYDELLKKFFESHDPTQFNRQGPDVGSQYRSVIFYHSPEQQTAAERAKKQLQESGRYGVKTIATAIESAGEFYPAEEYHQKYLMKRDLRVCH